MEIETRMLGNISLGRFLCSTAFTATALGASKTSSSTAFRRHKTKEKFFLSDADSNQGLKQNSDDGENHMASEHEGTYTSTVTGLNPNPSGTLYISKSGTPPVDSFSYTPTSTGVNQSFTPSSHGQTLTFS